MRLRILLVVFGIILNSNSLQAAWWNEEALPLPINTREVKKETQDILKDKFEVIHYASLQNSSSIRDFYRSKLPNLGWEEGDSSSEEKLVFRKDNELLTINFKPQGFFPNDNRTYYVLSSGKIDLTEEKAETEKELGPGRGELAPLEKEIFPLYPWASLISPSGQAQPLITAYSTKDNIEKVVSFYQAKMPDYGWSLAEEEPVKLMEPINIEAIAKDCPSCAKHLTTLSKLEMRQARLTFSQAKGDSCSIFFSQSKAGEGADASLNLTSIMVEYYAQKR